MVSSDNLPAIAPNKSDWELLQRQCMAFIDSGLLPEHITRAATPKQALAKALTIAWKGRELGLPPLYSFSNIQVIGGKPALSAELMLALVYRRCPGAKVTFTTPVEKQNTECEVVMQRPNGDPQTFRFTIEDARRANLIRSKGPWETYPAAMLRARTIAAGARAVFPDCTLGLYTPEELGGDIIEAEFSTEKPVHDTPTAKQAVPGELPIDEPIPAPNLNTGAMAPRNKPPQADYPRARIGWENDLATEPQHTKLWAMLDDTLGKTAEDSHMNEFIFNTLGDGAKLETLTKAQMQHLYLELDNVKGPKKA